MLCMHPLIKIQILCSLLQNLVYKIFNAIFNYFLSFINDFIKDFIEWYYCVIKYTNYDILCVATYDVIKNTISHIMYHITYHVINALNVTNIPNVITNYSLLIYIICSLLIYLYGIIIFATIRKHIRFIEEIPFMKNGIIIYNIIQFLASTILGVQIIASILYAFWTYIIIDFKTHIIIDFKTHIINDVMVDAINHEYIMKNFIYLLIVSLYNDIPYGIIPNLSSIIFEIGLLFI